MDQLNVIEMEIGAESQQLSLAMTELSQIQLACVGGGNADISLY
jgi:hypothetical protein